MSEKFTRGPWYLGKYGELKSEKGKGSEGQVRLRMTCNAMFDDAEAEANMRLIAAAPEMYEALIECMECLDLKEGSEPYDTAAAILAKARGESQ